MTMSAIDQAAIAVKTASPIVATNNVHGASTRNGAATRAASRPATARVATSTATGVVAPIRMMVTASQPWPRQPDGVEQPQQGDHAWRMALHVDGVAAEARRRRSAGTGRGRAARAAGTAGR